MKSNQHFEVLDVILYESYNEIKKYLQLGTSIPIWPEFEKYIISDLKYYNAKSILIKKEGNIVGHTLIFHIKSDFLYFGYFWVASDIVSRIQYLINQLLKYAKDNNFRKIRGPINIPTIIFGWGFKKKRGVDSLYLGKPIHSPIYQYLFLQNGFKISRKEYTWEGSIPNLSKTILLYPELKNFYIFHPNSWKELSIYKKIFIELSTRNLAVESVITPNPEAVFDNYSNFVKEFGNIYMFSFIKSKTSNKIIGCGVCIPNPFRKDENGYYDSYSILSVVVEKKYRKKGLSLLIAKEAFDKAKNNNIKYVSTSIESRAKISAMITKKIFKLSKKRCHLILDYNF